MIWELHYVCTGVMAVAMVIVFGVEYDDNFSGYDLTWSFYCCTYTQFLVLSYKRNPIQEI